MPRQISKGKHAVEQLHHMNCGTCGKWWTIGDAPQSKKKWFCPWCGSENDYGRRSAK